MTPGYVDRVTRNRCAECGGWDMGAIGSIHHRADCSRSPYCSICGLELLPGEKRGPGRVHAHLDCILDLEAQLDEEHRRG